MVLPSTNESELRTGAQGPLAEIRSQVVASTLGSPAENTPSAPLDIAGAFTGPDALYGDRPATQEVKREQPQHRIMVMLKAQGYTNREIAAAMDVTTVCVGQVLRQPWARARLLSIFETRGMSKIDSLLSAEAVASLETLIEIRDSSDAGASARLSASNSLLDRYLGKAKERLEVKSDTTLRDAASVDAELSRLEAAEAALLGRVVRGN